MGAVLQLPGAAKDEPGERRHHDATAVGMKDISQLTLSELAALVEEMLPDPEIPSDWSNDDAFEIMAAHFGDYEPLRKRYPNLAPFLNPPRLGRGKYPRKLKDRPSAVVGAAAYVRGIRAALRKLYEGRRPPFTAPEVAAEIWGCDLDALEAFMKPSGKRKPPSQ
jgi:hypothetical protein